jgi:hypothetical protein
MMTLIVMLMSVLVMQSTVPGEFIFEQAPAILCPLHGSYRPDLCRGFQGRRYLLDPGPAHRPTESQLGNRRHFLEGRSCGAHLQARRQRAYSAQSRSQPGR